MHLLPGKFGKHKFITIEVITFRMRRQAAIWYYYDKTYKLDTFLLKLMMKFKAKAKFATILSQEYECKTHCHNSMQLLVDGILESHKSPSRITRHGSDIFNASNFFKSSTR